MHHILEPNMLDFASRIAKLDAVSLDNEFLSFLKREITGLLTAVTSEEFLHKFKPEISLLVRFLVWKFTTSTGSTIGQKLLGIQYAPFPRKLKMLFVLEGVIPYILERVESIHDSPRLELVLRGPIKNAEKLFKVLHMINFCTFLFQNRYPTVSTRLLGLPMVSTYRRFGPTAGYTYQIRELLWHQYADFLITILPMMNFQKLRRYFGNWFGSGKTPRINPSNEETSQRKSVKDVKKDDDSNESPRACAVCNETAVLPQKVAGEYYCYYCYQAVMEEKF